MGATGCLSSATQCHRSYNFISKISIEIPHLISTEPCPSKCTLGKVLGFTQDVNTVNETMKMLEDNSVSLRSGDPELLEVCTMRTEGCGQCAHDGMAFPPSSGITRWGGC